MNRAGGARESVFRELLGRLFCCVGLQSYLTHVWCLAVIGDTANDSIRVIIMIWLKACGALGITSTGPLDFVSTARWYGLPCRCQLISLTPISLVGSVASC